MTPEEQELQKLVAEIAFHHRAAPEKNGTARDILRAAIRAAEAAARADGWRAGAEAMREVAAAQAQEWNNAYPEDVFVGELGKIGRHITAHIRDEIRALPIPEPGTGGKGE